MKIRTVQHGAGNGETHFRSTLIATSVALAIAQYGTAMADSGVGQDTSIGNAMHTRGVDPARYGNPPDSEGVGATYDPVAHTPTGQMYEMPTQVRAAETKVGEWSLLGHVEAGVIGVDGDRKSQGFTRYKDLENGPYISSFGINAENPQDNGFIEANGGAVGQGDQFYSLQFGQYNLWKIKAFYNQTTHTFTTSYRSLYDGVGTGNLTLSSTALANGVRVGGIKTPALDGVGANTVQTQGEFVTAGNAALAATGESRLGITRSKGGVRADLSFLDKWKFFASFTSEKREGARPFGVTWGGGGTNANVEIAEPIDYRTNDLIAGVQYADKLNAFNLTVNASWFRNNIDTLTFDNITSVNNFGALNLNGVTAANGGFSQGRLDLYPNNDYYSAKGEYARQLPDIWKGRFTAVVSLATSRQNDDLIPFTVNPNVVAAGLSNWHTTDSLSRKTADARIDTRLIDLGLSLNPLDTLNVKGKVRYYETRNHTEFLLCNSAAGGDPANTASGYGCTGVWGRVVNDGSGTSFGSTATGNAYIRNIPFDYKQLIYAVDADYRLGKASSISAGYERESYHRDHRERDETWEDKYKLGYVNRGVRDGTLRLSFEHDRRRGDEYQTHHPYTDFYSGYLWDPSTAVGTNLTTFVVHMNSRLRKYDLADRNQNIVNARFNYMLRHDLDLGIATQFKDMKYPDSEYGRVDHQRLGSLNLDLSWQPGAQTNVYAFYSRQQGKIKQQGVPSGAVAGFNCNIGNNGLTIDNAEYLCADPNTGRVFNAANLWSQTHRDTSDTFGLGVKQMIRDVLVDMNYTYSLGRTEISYSTPANMAAAQAALAGSGFEDLKTSQHTLELNMLKPLSKSVLVRLLYRHERGKIDDWHYNGLGGVIPIGTGAGVFMDGGAQGYRINMLGVLLNVRL